MLGITQCACHHPLCCHETPCTAVGRSKSSAVHVTLRRSLAVVVNSDSNRRGAFVLFQIRFQGYKGVLSRYSPLRGRAIQLRPSMNKFGSLHPQLEAVSVAAYRPLYLNRQAIIMMNHNGVPEEVRMEYARQNRECLASHAGM